MSNPILLSASPALSALLRKQRPTSTPSSPSSTKPAAPASFASPASSASFASPASSASSSPVSSASSASPASSASASPVSSASSARPSASPASPAPVLPAALAITVDSVSPSARPSASPASPAPVLPAALAITVNSVPPSTPSVSPSSLPLLPRQLAFRNRYPTRASVEQAFSPSLWGYSAQHADRALLANCVSLASLDRLYGEGSANHWLRTQLVGLFVASSSHDSAIVDTVRFMAPLLAGIMLPYKLSELTLFFAGFSAGVYGANDWHSFDFRRIGAAFLHEFVPRRNRLLAMYEEEQRQRESEQRQANDRKKAITWEEYQRSKRTVHINRHV